jgi:hypothetical protein
MSSLTTRELNDLFRRGLRPDLGKLMITRGVLNLVAACPLGVMGLHVVVQLYNHFTSDNDPHGEHDFGSFEYGGETCFWKIDYYDKTMEHGSDDPSDPNKTRVCSRSCSRRSIEGMRYIEIEGKKYPWRDLLKLRREQKKAARQAQPALFELKEDSRPQSQRSPSSRYEEPSLFD